MDENRKKIIVREIQHWKQNRLLPDHYCDFLLNLYTEGDFTEVSSSKRWAFSKKPLLVLLLALMLSLSVFFFYFTELSFILQMAIAVIFGISSLLAAFYFISNQFFNLIPLLIAALVVLISTVQTASLIYPGNRFILFVIAAFNCLAWLGVGMKWKMVSFKVSGLAGLVILIFTIFL